MSTNVTQKLVVFREPCDMTVAVSRATGHLSDLGMYYEVM